MSENILENASQNIEDDFEKHTIRCYLHRTNVLL